MAIEDDEGLIHRGDRDIGLAATSYFTKLFQSSRKSTEDYLNVFEDFQPRVTNTMNKDLTKAISEDEIQKAVFDIGVDRAHGPDGIIGAFSNNSGRTSSQL